MRPRIVLFAMIASTTFFGAHSFGGSGGGPIVALFGVEDKGSGLEPEVLENLQDYSAARLTQCGYQVVPPEQIRERLNDQKRETHKVCYDQACQVELGRELAAQKSLSTKILRIGNTCQVTAVLYDLRRGTTDTAATAESECEVDALLGGVKSITEKLCKPMLQARKEADAGLKKFQKILKDVQHEKAESERIRKAWKIVSGIAKDKQLPRDLRVEAVNEFLKEFQKKNPYVEDAKGLLSDIDLANLVVVSIPSGASVALDGEKLGTTPLNHEAKAGLHELRLELDGHHVLRNEVELTPGERKEVKVTLRRVEKGKAHVATTPPGASVLVDGEEAGKAPVTLEVAAGPHLIAAELAGYDRVEKSIVVEPGGKAEVALVMGQSSGKLMVRTTPPGARIIIDGDHAGTSPMVADLEPGAHRIAARKDGFEEALLRSTVSSGDTTEVSLVLERPSSTLDTWATASFWSGLGLTAFGGVSLVLSLKAGSDFEDGDLSAEDNSRTWAGLMWAGFVTGAALITTGIVLWSLDSGDPDSEEPVLGARPGVWLDGDSAFFSLSGRW